MSRIDRVQEEIRHQVSMIVQRQLHDPRIGFVTITRVEVRPDLREARVYFTIMDTQKPQEDTIKALESSSRYVRRLIGQRIKIKFTPEIIFVRDIEPEARNRVDEIIDEIHKEKDA